MKKITILLTMFVGLLSTGKLLSQNVAINIDGSAPHASAMLDVKSTSKGLLIPRMTTLQRTTIPTPAPGLKVYDITTKSFHFFNGTIWIELASVNTSNYWLINGANIYNNNPGFVGIGTPAPTSRLHIIGNEASVPLRIQNKLATGFSGMQFHNSAGVLMGQTGFANATAPALANSFYAGSIGNAPFIFTTANVERMRISNTGYIGIGTAAPTSRLHIIGNEASPPLRIQNNLVTGSSGMQFHNSAGVLMGQMGFANASAPTLANSFYAGTIGSFPFIFTTANLERMRISNTGYVGIGTVAPTSRLHIIGNEASVPLRIQNNLATGLSGMQFHNSAGVLMGQMGFANSAVPALGNSFYAGSIGAASFILTTKNLERMRIDSTGNIGIGTAAAAPNASAMLDIKSTNKGLLIPRMTLAQRNLIALPATSLMVYQTDNTPGYYFYNGTGWVPITSGGSTNYWMQNGTDIYKNNTGNVGIGTSTPASPLHLYNNSVSEILRLQGNQPYLSFRNLAGQLKTYVQGYNDDLLIGTAFGNPTGDIRFYLNNVEQMTILDNGNVGIGTNAPGAPLSFPNLLGNKISLWRNGPNNDFGIGINPGVMQLYTAGQDKIAFGWGNANAFTETIAIQTGTGMIAYPNLLGNKISFWRNGPNNDFGIGINPGVMQIYTAGQDRIAFGWGNANVFNETMTLFTGNGFLGMGTTNPLAKLHINQNDEALRLSGNSPFLSLFNGANWNGSLGTSGNNIELGTPSLNSNGSIDFFIKGITQMSVQNDGRVRVGALPCVRPMSSFGYSELPKFSVQGALGLRINYGDQIAEWAINPSTQDLDFYYNGGLKAHVEGSDGDWIGESDIRLKENFENYKSVLERIKKLDVLTYHYKADKTGKRSFGLVAQNVQQYFPEIVSTGRPDGFMGISYGKTGVLAIKAIQEQQVIIETQQRKIDDLEKRMMVLENLLNK